VGIASDSSSARKAFCTMGTKISFLKGLGTNQGTGVPKPALRCLELRLEPKLRKVRQI
jgi:hypothetical protein